MSCACAVSRRWNLWTMINIQYSYTSVIGRAHAGGERRAIRIDCVPSSHLASEHFVNSFVPLQEGGGQRESQYYCYSRRRPRLHKRGRWNWEAINLGRLSRAHVWAANSFLSRAKEKLSTITKKSISNLLFPQFLWTIVPPQVLLRRNLPWYFFLHITSKTLVLSSFLGPKNGEVCNLDVVSRLHYLIDLRQI